MIIKMLRLLLDLLLWSIFNFCLQVKSNLGDFFLTKYIMIVNNNYSSNTVECQGLIPSTELEIKTKPKRMPKPKQSCATLRHYNNVMLAMNTIPIPNTKY